MNLKVGKLKTLLVKKRTSKYELKRKQMVIIDTNYFNA